MFWFLSSLLVEWNIHLCALMLFSPPSCHRTPHGLGSLDPSEVLVVMAAVSAAGDRCAFCHVGRISSEMQLFSRNNTSEEKELNMNFKKQKVFWTI